MGNSRSKPYAPCPPDELLEQFSQWERGALLRVFGVRTTYVPHSRHPAMAAAEVDHGKIPADVSPWCAYNYCRLLCRQEVDRVGQGAYTIDLLERMLPPALAAVARRNELIEANVSLPIVISNRFPRAADRDELWSSCHEALIDAVEAYDEERGMRFSSYACRAMLYRCYQHAVHIASDSQPIYDEEGAYSAQTLDVNQARRSTIQAIDVRELIGDLGARERRVIERRFGLFAPSEKLEEIGADMGCTRERVRQIQNRALRRLREWMQSPTTPRAC